MAINALFTGTSGLQANSAWLDAIGNNLANQNTTGYKGQGAMVEALFGPEMAKHVGPVWGFDDNQELANMWMRTPQRGLWFTGGSFSQCRMYSRYLAMQIKAQEIGLV